VEFLSKFPRSMMRFLRKWLRYTVEFLPGSEVFDRILSL
jgi:hypothetical protein